MYRTLALIPALAMFAACAGDDTKPTGDTGDGPTTNPTTVPTTTGEIECGAAATDPCIVTGTITENVTFEAARIYLLRGGVFIGDDVNATTLTIEAGTQIFGETSTNGMLVVQPRRPQIMAEGHRGGDPIVMTSSLSDGQPRPW